MPKDSLYFSHDFGARNDPKLQDVQMRMGMEGIGIYWCVVESLYEQGGYLPLTAIRGLAFALHVEEVKVESVIRDFGLFTIADDGLFYSSSAIARTEKKRKISEARAEAGRLGGIAKAEARKAATAEKVPDLFDGVDEEPEGEDGGVDDGAVAERIIAKCGTAQAAALQSYDGPPSDIERFFEVFHFERNVASAWSEVARFVAHYQPDGWRRKGSPYPVTDRVALARAFDQQDGLRRAFADPRPLSYLRRVYGLLRTRHDPERWRLVTEVRSMAVVEETEGTLGFRYKLSKEAMQLIERVCLRVPGIKIYYEP